MYFRCVGVSNLPLQNLHIYVSLPARGGIMVIPLRVHQLGGNFRSFTLVQIFSKTITPTEIGEDRR